MDHPGIARVFDAGATETGRLFFVMELVHGVPLTEYCDSHRLPTRERIALFIQVCQAVQHAHQKGVIHRDIKPSNVLVSLQDGRPVPKIIDFGVAKAIDHRLTDRTLFTEIGQRIGTPAYMSPEQMEMSRLDVDTRTDIYSLGVTLYVLLAGALPLESEEVEKALASPQILRDTDLPTPSARLGQLGERQKEIASRRQTDPASLRRALKGDLDWIVLRAMAQDRSHRYETANALALDLQRYLNSEPVAARPPSSIYRTGRFIRRHRAGVGFAASLVVSLVAFAVTMALQAQRIARERDRAEQVSELLVELFEISDPTRSNGDTITAREILDKGAQKVQTGLSDQPLVRAALLDTLGRVYHNLGLYARGEQLLRQALDLRVGSFGEETLEAAQSQTHLGLLLHDQSQYSAAEPLLRKALATRREKLGEHHKDVAAAYNNVAFVLEETGDYAGSEALYRRALDIERSLPEQDRVIEDSILSNLGAVLYRKGDHQAAEPFYQEALAIRRRQHGSDHLDVALSLNNLGALYYARRDYARAEPFYREAIAIRRKLLGDDHPSTLIALNNFANLLSEKGDLIAAEPLYREVLATRRKTLPPGHQNLTYSLAGLARLLLERGNDGEAEALLGEAVINEARLPPGDWQTAYVRGLLGRALAGQGQYAKGEPLLEASYRLLRDKRGKDDTCTRRLAGYLDEVRRKPRP
jgi:non-specific serine/threonine protein kinase/serine/threonine-protein kinase